MSHADTAVDTDIDPKDWLEHFLLRDNIEAVLMLTAAGHKRADAHNFVRLCILQGWDAKTMTTRFIEIAP